MGPRSFNPKCFAHAESPLCQCLVHFLSCEASWEANTSVSGFFASKLLNHAIVHWWRHAIFHEMTSAVPIELGTHGLDRPHDSFLLISGPLR